MSCTAVVTVSDSAVVIGSRVKCTVTITNSSTALQAIDVQPLVSPTGLTSQNVAAVAGNPYGGIVTVTNPLTIAATGTTTIFYFDVFFQAPMSTYGLSEPASYVYDVGCIITTLDGATRAVVTSTVANVTVTPPSY